MKRWLLIGLGVLVALLVIVDVGARFAAEAATAKALTSSLDLSSQPKVTIQGVPFLAHVASGSFPSVTLDGQEVDSGELTLKSVHAVLHDVHVPIMSLAQGHRVDVTAESGTGTAVITANEITRVLQNKGLGVTVEFKGGQVQLQVPGIPAFVNATVGVESGQLVLRSTVLSQVIPGVSLPRVIPGARYTTVRLVGDEALLGFTLENPSFAVGG
jgi:LmeA-like phospholipid-binding